MKSCFECGRGRVADESLFIFKSRRLIGFQANYFLILYEPAVSTAPMWCFSDCGSFYFRASIIWPSPIRSLSIHLDTIAVSWAVDKTKIYWTNDKERKHLVRLRRKE